MRRIALILLLFVPGCAVSRSTVVVSTTVDDVEVRYECELVCPGFKAEQKR